MDLKMEWTVDYEWTVEWTVEWTMEWNSGKQNLTAILLMK